MVSESLKEKIYKELSRGTRALSNPKRMELLDLLSNKEWSVEELSGELSLSVANTSQHLQVLKSARLVKTRRKGNFIFYSVADDRVLRLIAAVRELGFNRYAEVEKLITDFKVHKNILESLTLDDLMKRSAKEKILLIDVRPLDEYQAGHIPEAVSIPLSQLKKRIHQLPRGKTIVAYCRGPLCVMAVEAVKILQGKKIKAVRMEEGYVEWKLKQLETIGPDPVFQNG